MNPGMKKKWKILYENKMKDKIPSYQEYLAEIKCKQQGCLESVVEYIETKVPSDFTDYKSLGISEGLLGQYYDFCFRSIIGKRSL